MPRDRPYTRSAPKYLRSWNSVSSVKKWQLLVIPDELCMTVVILVATTKVVFKPTPTYLMQESLIFLPSTKEFAWSRSFLLPSRKAKTPPTAPKKQEEKKKSQSFNGSV